MCKQGAIIATNPIERLWQSLPRLNTLYARMCLSEAIRAVGKRVFNRIIASTRPHFADITKLSVRDTELVIATALLMCALSWYTGRQDLHRILAASPTAAQHVTLEITEDVFIARAADAIQASIASFRDLGVRISLDDFGTGFASFHHLRQLDFDELKIDTSFVAGLGHDLTSEVLVRGFLNIASGLGVNVIAEGVETQAQSQEFINIGSVAAQGYLFSPDVPLAQAAELFIPQKTA
jgi:predicted signal transduction protein with EAL and GGDEF domain